MYITHIISILFIRTVFLIEITYSLKIGCTNSDEFYYPLPGTNCSSYYKCLSVTQKEVLDCPHGFKYDFYNQICSRSSDACPDLNCAGLAANGIYQDNAYGCKRYYTCSAGQLTDVESCPSGQLYNGHKCVHQNLVRCEVSSSTLNKQQSLKHPYNGDMRCSDHTDGFYAANDYCTEYLVCKDGKVTDIRICPSNYLFHKAQQRCLSKHMVTECRAQEVKSNEDAICEEKQDGPVADPLSQDCTTYVICKAGKIDRQKRCGSQAVFNGEDCVPSPLYKCPVSKRHANLPLSESCRNKPDGYYASPQYGCSSYIRCSEQGIVEIGECPSDYYFDRETQRCIFERFFERRRCFDRGLSLDCDGKTNGFHTDYNCETYYYCNNGYKSEYKCSANKVFNGERCVPKSEHKCPKFDGDSFCLSKPDGYYKDSKEGCRAYNYCSNGHKITYLCETGHVFDEKTKTCVRRETVGQHYCRSDYICSGKSDGYHQDLNSRCRNYVYCKNYEKITQLTCRNGNVFDGQKCVPPHMPYACPSSNNHRQVNCIPKKCVRHTCEKDGFYADLSSDCRDYYFCIGGKSSKISCSAGKRFNGEICVAEDKFRCPVQCSNNNKSDGGFAECPQGGFIIA